MASDPQDHALHPRLSVKATRPITRYRTTIYSDLSRTDMDDIQGSLSKMKKKFKQRLTGKKHKPDGTGASPGEETPDSTSSLPQPDPHVVADESNDQEGDRADAAGERAPSTVRPPQPDGPESVPARGNDNRQEGVEAGVDGEEADQNDSHPCSDVEVAVGSGRSGELEAVDPSPSTPSISHGAEPGGTWTWLFWFLFLIALSDNVDTSALPNRGPEAVRPDESLEPGTAADEEKSNPKPMASPTAELLREVRDSPGGYGSLKSVAKSLCSILDSCEVWPPSRALVSRCSWSF